MRDTLRSLGLKRPGNKAALLTSSPLAWLTPAVAHPGEGEEAA